MIKAFGIAVLMGLAGCASVAQDHSSTSACSVSETSYECQVERYNHVNY